MANESSYDFQAALRTILSRVAEAEIVGNSSEEQQIMRRDALRYQRQLAVLQAELERMLAQIAQPAGNSPPRAVVPGTLPAKRLACHHADSADATRLIEGDLPPWMIDCSEPH